MAPAVRGQRHHCGGRQDDMPLFIALGLLVAVSTAYLLHQFLSHSLESSDQSAPAEAPAASNSDHLKAA
jgi:hypothetical protein